MVNTDRHLDRIENLLGDKSLDVAMRKFLV